MSQFAELRAQLCRLSEENQQAALRKSRGARIMVTRAALADLPARLACLFERRAVPTDGPPADLPAWTRMPVPSPATALLALWHGSIRPALASMARLLRRSALRLAGLAALAAAHIRRFGRAIHGAPSGLRRVGLGLGTAALLIPLGGLVLEGMTPGPATATLLGSADLAVDRDHWLPTERPIEVFSISAPSFIEGEISYRAERNAAGAGRRDTLTLGAFDGDGPWLGVTLHRQLSSDGHELGASAARLSAGTAGQPTGSITLDTKFGPIIAASIPAGTPGRQHACLAFGHIEDALHFAFQGLYCAAEGKAAEPRTLACLVDRIDLIGAAGDPQLRAFFVGTEKRRDFCGAGDLRATGAKRAWFQGGPAAAAPYGGPTTRLSPQLTHRRRKLK